MGFTNNSTRGGFLGGGGGLESGGTISGNLTVTGTVNTGAATLASVAVTGAATVGTTLGVTGATTAADITSSGTIRTKISAHTVVDIGAIIISSQFDPSLGSHQRFNTAGSSFTMTGGPIILAGAVNGQLLRLENNGASGAATITDVATDTDSGVITLSGSVGIGALDSADFVWDSVKALWCQVANENN